MFWRFGGYANISSIDNILDKPDVTLEELLDENDVIQELKAQNAKLIEFLRDDVALAKLLKYLLAPKLPESPAQALTPEATERTRGGFFAHSRSKARSKSRSIDEDLEQEEAKRTKFAFVSCEILSSEVWSISESLLESSHLLRDFWEYIKNDTPLDNRTAGYFAKVNEALLEKKPAEMVAFIKTLDNVVVNLMKHVDCPVMMDLLLKLISLEKEPTTQGIVDWLQTQDLIPIFLSYITPEHPASTQTAAGDFLKAIITISANATGQDASVIGPNELTRQLVSEDCITRLLDEMLQGGNPLTVGVGIIIEVIRKNNSDYDTEGQVSPEPKSSDPIYLGTLLRKFASHVPKFMELILSKNHTVVTEKGSESIERKKLDVAWGEKIEPLGFDRFKTCELMAELLHCSNMRLLNEKGSEAQMRLRDVERERLKSEGKLSTEPQHRQGAESGTSVDSSGFHHAEALSPLGGSPEDIRTLEVQNSGDDEEEFEKVAVSEAMPDSPQNKGADQAGDASLPTEELRNMDLEDDNVMADSKENAPSRPRPLSKRRISLLTLMILDGETALSNNAGPNAKGESQNDDDHPAPLFSKRSAEQSTAAEAEGDAMQIETSSEQADGSQSSRKNDESEQQQPDVQLEDDGSPVVGDLLKMMFVDNHVVPTILDFFFRFPWNNFLHNVVYDVVQQVFNGSMDRGFNRNLAIDLFESGRVTNRVVEGQERSDKSQKECKRRLGYMGHLTLIAEEVVKFTERQPPELLAQSVVDKIMDPEWTEYVDHTLSETRDRDNAILGGVRPDHSVGPRQAVLNAVNASQGGFGSSALANAGLSGNVSGGLDSLDLANAGAAGYGLNSPALLSGFGGSDDEEDEDMEDGELGGYSADDFQRRSDIDDDDDQSSPQVLIPPQQPSSDPPPIPAPLAVPPSRARRQLAVRLAEKQRLAASDNGSPPDEADELSNSQSSVDQAGPHTPASSSGSASARGAGGATATSAATPGIVPRRLSVNAGVTAGDGFPDVENNEDVEDEEGSSGGNGFTDDFTGYGGGESTGTETGTEGEGDAEDGSDEDDEEEEEDDDSADEVETPTIRRQTTSEAVQRRPLDGDDDSDEYSDDIQLPPPVQQPNRRMSASEAAGAKKREQDRLLRRWGFDEEEEEEAEGGGGDVGGASASAAGRTTNDIDTDEDDDDDDDEPVLMGSKYTARRRTGS